MVGLLLNRANLFRGFPVLVIAQPIRGFVRTLRASPTTVL